MYLTLSHALKRQAGHLGPPCGIRTLLQCVMELFPHRQGPELRVHTSLPSCPRTVSPTVPSRIIEASGDAGGVVLKEIVAYVEVWSSQQDRKTQTQLQYNLRMGTKVLKPFNK